MQIYSYGAQENVNRKGLMKMTPGSESTFTPVNVVESTLRKTD